MVTLTLKCFQKPLVDVIENTHIIERHSTTTIMWTSWIVVFLFTMGMTIGFLPPSSIRNIQRYAPTRGESSWLQLDASRRTCFLTIVLSWDLILGHATMEEAIAKETESALSSSLLATHENVQKAFDALRYELNGANGGVATMQRAVDASDWETLLSITKTYDQTLRKGQIGRIRSFLSDKERSILTLSANAITFDLIGINRNSRPGQENAAEANRYLDELRTDLQLIIDKQKLVMYAD
jgi:hypothetical protein